MLYYKYRDFGGFSEKIITESSVYFSPVHKLNDPFDCKLSFREDYTPEEIIGKLKDGEKLEDFKKRRDRAKNQMIEEIGVFSLAKSFDNILMWSHYANEHKGLVFGFDTLKLDFKMKDTLNNINPIRVEYNCTYKELSYIEDMKIELPKLMLTKYKDWQYENEYRMIDLYQNGAKKFPKKALSTIIFGAKSDECHMEEFIELCKHHDFGHVKFKKAKIVDGKFQLKFEEIIGVF